MKNLSNKYSQNLLNGAKKSIRDTTKTAPKKAILKIAEPTCDLIGNKIAETSVSKKTQKNKSEAGSGSLKDVPKKKDTYLQKKDNKFFINWG